MKQKEGKSNHESVRMQSREQVEKQNSTVRKENQERNRFSQSPDMRGV